MRRTHALVPLLITLLLALAASPAEAHLGADDGFNLSTGQDPLVDVLSLAAALTMLLGGLAYLVWTGARDGWGFTPAKGAVVLGQAWVAAGLSATAGAVGTLPWQLLSAGLILGTLAMGWWVALRALEPAWPALRGDRRLQAVAGVAALAFLGLFAFGTHMVLVPSADEVAALGAGAENGYLEAYEAFGPLAMWPALVFWWPAASLTGYVTPITLAIALGLSGLFGLAIATAVGSWSGRGAAGVGGAGGVSMVTSFCACCTPAFYPVLVALFGSGAAPVVYAISDPDLPIFNVAQVANVWLLAWAVTLGARRFVAACELPGMDGEAAAPDAVDASTAEA